jgi:hypothetical protein
MGISWPFGVFCVFGCFSLIIEVYNMFKLLGPRLKLIRAKRHCQSLDLVLKRFIDHNPYTFVGGLVEEPDGFYYAFNAHISRRIPDIVSLLIGDACYNLRAALEQALWQLCLKADPTYGRRVYYPIFSDPDAYRDNGRSHVRDIAKRYQTVIEDSQPYKTGSDALAILAALNNADKHRDIPVTAAAANATASRVSGARLPLTEAGSLPAWYLPLPRNVQIIEGAELIRLPLGASRPARKVEVSCTVEIRVVFGDSQEIALAQGRTVVQTLQLIVSEVEQILDALESA